MENRRQILCVLGVASAFLVTGCGRPARVNIELRKQNQALQKQVDELSAREKANDLNRIVSTRPRDGVNLDTLYTATGISFGRLTGVDERVLRVYVAPEDQQGDTLKAAGGFTVLAYDLGKGPQALVGEWTFTPEQARGAWNGKGLLYTYVLPCPLPAGAAAAAGSKLRVRVTFQDLLTGRNLTGETDAPVR